jgi:putative transposase
MSTAWIDLETAARRSGKSVGHLRRKCGDLWMGQGMASLERPVGGGKSVWRVREDADASLSPVKFADQLTKEFDARELTESQRVRAADRKRIIDAWQADVAAGRQLRVAEFKVTAQFLDRLLLAENRTLSRATLFNWLRASREGFAGLVDGRGADRAAGAAGVDDRFLEEVKRLWLRQSRPRLKTCYDHALLLAEDQGWPTCSLKTIDRRIKQLPKQLIIKCRLGDSAFANQALPAPRRNYAALRTNQVWCADHHQFDVIVRDAEGKHCRPWITAWEDLRSRKIVGWHIFAHDPNQTTILLSFRSACLAHGIPEEVYIDNGKDFDCYALQGMTKKQRRRIRVQVDPMKIGGIFGALKVGVTHAIPQNAKAKPVERFFNTVCTRFSRMFWPTYCGNSPADKPENLQDQLARGNAPTVTDFAERFGVWLDADYHGREHTGYGMDGLTPHQAFEKHLISLRAARSEELQLFIAKTSRPITAGRNGVIYGGITYGRGDSALYAYFGKKVYLRVDPDNVNVAAVYDQADRLIAEVAASADMPFGATDQEFRQAERERRQVRELTNKYRQLGPRQNADTLQLMQIKRQEAAAKVLIENGSPTDPPPSIVPFRTPLEGQAIPLRKAVGAEHLSQPRRPKIIDLMAAADELELQQRQPAAPRRSLLYGAES